MRLNRQKPGSDAHEPLAQRAAGQSAPARSLRPRPPGRAAPRRRELANYRVRSQGERRDGAEGLFGGRFRTHSN